ncbi:MAG: LysR family transcriptional regulator [Acidobacteriota bacterium]
MALNVLSPQDLLVIATIAEAGTLTAAAQELGTSQPALSRTLRTLEARAEAPLFERRLQGVTPTVAGEALLRHGRAVQAITRRAEDELAVVRDEAGSELRVGIVPRLSPVPVARTITTLNREARPVRVSLTLGAEPELLDDLREGRLDLLLARQGQPLAELRVTPLFEDQPVLVARVDHSVRDGWDEPDFDALAALSEQRWVLPPAEDPATIRLKALFRDGGREAPRPGLVTHDLPLAVVMVLEAGYLSVLPQAVLAFGGHLVAAAPLPVTLPGPPESACLLQRPDIEPTGAQERFVEVLKGELEKVGLHSSSAP